MNCPKCGHEVSEGAERCPSCAVELTWEVDGEDPEHLPDALVTVLESSDPMLIPVVRSLLEAEGIPVMVENELLQELMGGGRIGTGYNTVVGPAIVRVRAEDEEAARALLAHHFESSENEPIN